jgi:hypothetical protein
MFICFMYFLRPRIRSLESKSAPQKQTIAEITESAPARKGIRIDYVIQASIKAFLVAACSSLGNQFGLWLGGVAALLVTTVVATCFSTPHQSTSGGIESI